MERIHQINLELAVISTVSYYLGKHKLDGFKESKEVATVLTRIVRSLPPTKEHEGV